MNLTKAKNVVLRFEEIGLDDVRFVGGKNASLGEMFRTLRPLGVQCRGGFATTAKAFQLFLDQGGLRADLTALFAKLDHKNPDSLTSTGKAGRARVLQTPLPETVIDEVIKAYINLNCHFGEKCKVAVRSSATAEDLPGASFAGQYETYLNVAGTDHLLEAIRKCYASAFTDRAIDYRARHGFEQMAISLSVGVQTMVNVSDGASGVIFTLDPESGFRNVVVVSGAYGLGEYLVQGSIVPDEWTVFKPTLDVAAKPILGKKVGSKERRLLLAAEGTVGEDVPAELRAKLSLTDEEVIQLARWSRLIEKHYSEHFGNEMPMDIEWAKDGDTGELYILQARPETVHAGKSKRLFRTYEIDSRGAEPIVVGQAVGEKVASGPVHIVTDPSELSTVLEGEVLVARVTDPDWEPAMKRVAAIVTDEGGRTAHAAIVSREIGTPCIVGAQDATTRLTQGQIVTVSCAEGLEGRVYDGALPFKEHEFDTSALPKVSTALMLNVGDPDKAFSFAEIPNAGVGLARIEFIINNAIGIHPMALVRFPNLKDVKDVEAIRSRIGQEEPKSFFVSALASGVGRIAAAFHPNPVIVRMSDFKTNEYAKLLGGQEFEPAEENPMLGFRGASRYYDPRYEEGFALECEAIRTVREEMKLRNVKVMIPFCRTVAEAKKVIETMARYGLKQGENGLQVYGMCEVPSNVLLAEEFLSVFDGFSIGSNDLTQLVLGIDRDSGTISSLFDERNEAVKKMLEDVISVAKRLGKPIGICGQAPSDYPEMAQWLVDQGITSISLNPDSVVKTALLLAKAERELPVIEGQVLPVATLK